MTSTVLTVDAIDVNADDELIVTLVNDAGTSVVIPLSLLPHGTREGDVVTLTFALEPEETESRRRRVADLQKRLFG